MPKFMLVSFTFGSARRKTEEIKAVFNQEKDWYRYTANCWIIWTEKTANEIWESIKPEMPDGAKVFICELNGRNRQGWMNHDFWEWMIERETETAPT